VEDSVEGEQAEEKSDGFGEFKQHAPTPWVCAVVYLFQIGLGRDDKVEIQIAGVNLHARQQTISMLDSAAGRS